MKALLKSIIGGIALAQRAKNAAEALEADLDNDGIPEKQELQKELLDCKPVLLDLVARAKRIFALSLSLANHVLEAAKK